MTIKSDLWIRRKAAAVQFHVVARRAAGALAASAIRGAVRLPEIRIEGE